MAQSTNGNKEGFNIAIVGGGIGGLCLAIGLIRRDIRVQIYEQAPAFAEIGAGIGFGPNSIRSMGLIDPEIKRAFDQLRTRNLWKDEEDTWINFRHGVGPPTLITDVRTNDDERTGLSSVHRAHMLDALVNLVPKEIANFGKRLCELEISDGEMGLVKLHFDDGTAVEADAVVGCDGVKSKVRQILFEESDPLQDAFFSGKYAYRGLVPMDRAKEHLGGNLAENSQMYLGPRGNVLTYPIDHGKTMNVIAFKTKQDGKWTHNQWVLANKKKDLKDDFQDWGQPVKEIVKMLDAPDQWALFEQQPAQTYYIGPIAIMGDAAHGSTPHQGAGAGMAVEDAFIMCSLLEDRGIKTSADIPRAFAAFDHIRRPRSQKVVETSHEAGELYGFEGPQGENIEKIKEDLQTRYRWIWEEDLEKELDLAKVHLSGA